MNLASRALRADMGGAPLALQGELSLPQFREVAAILQQEARIHLADAKMTLVHSRLGRRLREHGLTEFADYLLLVRENPEERQAMVVALTTNHTHFFRERHHFDHLRDIAMPIFQKRAHGGGKVRIWSAGCSSGEEIFSIAMTLAGESASAAAWLRQGDIRLLATDLAPHVVEAVGQGCYSDSTIEPIPAVYRRQWLRQEGPDRHVVSDMLRSLVTARVLNLFQPWPMRQTYDAIFCRNVMIYFDDRSKAELEARLVEMLAPGGYLYIGHSERLVGPAAQMMEPAGQTIYVKAGGVRR